MTIEWNIIMWCCVTIVALILLFLLVYYFMSARMMKKRRQQVLEINDNIKVGKRVMFAGMIGKIVEVSEGTEIIKVEIAKNTVVEISRFAVTNVVEA